MEKITIIGTGLIGASLGLAVKKLGHKDIMLVGTDIDRRNANRAHKMGAVDKVERRLDDAVKDAGVVIIATPVMAMQEVMETIAPYLREGCLVSDTGSTKGVVLEWAEKYLPEGVNFIAGHPMAGKELSGPEAADASLFQGCTYCLIPSGKAAQSAARLMIDIVTAIGAKPYFIGVEEHDSFAAAVSHLPLLLSVALVGCTSKSPSWSDIAQVASTGYRDLTRLASGDPTMHRDMCLSNNELLAHWVDTFIRELYEVRKNLLDSDGPALEAAFNQALEARNRWLVGAVTPESIRGTALPQIPSFAEGMGEMMMGRGIMDAQKRALGRWDKSEKDR